MKEQNFILQSLHRHRQIRNDPRKHRFAGVLRRRQTLDILHNEDGGLVHLDDSQVLPVEEVLFILVKVLVLGASGAPCKGIRLTGWAADQYPGFLSLQCRANFPVDIGFVGLAKLQASRFGGSMLEGTGHGRDPAESGLIDLTAYVAVVVLDVLGATQTPEYCPERQRTMCDSILFNGKGNLEEWLPLVAPQGSKSLPEPSWTGKKINYGNRHASSPPLGSFPNVIRLPTWRTLTLPPASSC